MTQETKTLSVTSAPAMILEPEKWAQEMQKHAYDYVGMPEAAIFLTAARRFRALADKLKIENFDPFKSDGFVQGGDIK